MTGELLRFPTPRPIDHLTTMDPVLEWSSAAAPRPVTPRRAPGRRRPALRRPAARSDRRTAALTAVVALALGGASVAAAYLLPWF